MAKKKEWIKADDIELLQTPSLVKEQKIALSAPKLGFKVWEDAAPQFYQVGVMATFKCYVCLASGVGYRAADDIAVALVSAPEQVGKPRTSENVVALPIKNPSGSISYICCKEECLEKAADFIWIEVISTL